MIFVFLIAWVGKEFMIFLFFNFHPVIAILIALVTIGGIFGLIFHYGLKLTAKEKNQDS